MHFGLLKLSIGLNHLLPTSAPPAVSCSFPRSWWGDGQKPGTQLCSFPPLPVSRSCGASAPLGSYPPLRSTGEVWSLFSTSGALPLRGCGQFLPGRGSLRPRPHRECLPAPWEHCHSAWLAGSLSESQVCPQKRSSSDPAVSLLLRRGAPVWRDVRHNVLTVAAAP